VSLVNLLLEGFSFTLSSLTSIPLFDCCLPFYIPFLVVFFVVLPVASSGQIIVLRPLLPFTPFCLLVKI
jgi:hypothetical protein